MNNNEKAAILEEFNDYVLNFSISKNLNIKDHLRLLLMHLSYICVQKDASIEEFTKICEALKNNYKKLDHMLEQNNFH